MYEPFSEKNRLDEWNMIYINICIYITKKISIYITLYKYIFIYIIMFFFQHGVGTLCLEPKHVVCEFGYYPEFKPKSPGQVP